MSLMSKVEIKTKDGTCPSYVYLPVGRGPWPAVLVFMDGLGIRPAMLEIGERLGNPWLLRVASGLVLPVWTI
jgi:dienelactone hydrolase